MLHFEFNLNWLGHLFYTWAFVLNPIKRWSQGVSVSFEYQIDEQIDPTIDKIQFFLNKKKWKEKWREP